VIVQFNPTVPLTSFATAAVRTIGDPLAVTVGVFVCPGGNTMAIDFNVNARLAARAGLATEVAVAVATQSVLNDATAGGV
jgi:hypothetical protein